MENIEVWIREWFKNNSQGAETDFEGTQNYIESGWIDSFQFLELISDVEEYFGMSFSDDDFTKEEILTMDGLVKIISEKK